ncbi:MAG TPA: hypothetical protein VLT36_22545 [Candidatus Dormibacteraeota bacterium]|nr:hypothetical protein [Candidatus Dormibacteraeota bacterium]
MKTARFVSASALLSALAIILSASPSVLLADKVAEPQAIKRETNAAGFDLQVVEGQLVLRTGNVDATLGRVIDALREQYPEANIVMSPGLAKVKVGDLKLRGGRLTEELEAVRVASGEKFDLQTPAQAVPTIDPTTGMPVASTKAPSAGLYVLRQAQYSSRPPRILEAMNIGPYLEWLGRRPHEEGKRHSEQQELSELQEMIDAAVLDFKAGEGRDREHQDDQLIFKYHPGATLVVIIGSPDSVEIARKIVNALPGMFPAQAQANANRTAQQHAPDDAFRARYGLAPRDASAAQPGVPAQAPAKP